ncbi:hypothetical protein QD357_04670 [Rhizobium sp. BR 317]|uniref:Uncharacterized protein n=1 Tax=Rhizobium paranaense TaxID=1650438 RepID=A0A7W9D0H8_9HYPH|nr:MULTISPECIES: hypothetical protein [Rhizobium]MBB5573287.1 hypothetical protein [Rhizobium paranaense]PST62356.1 hypothetical protein C9E91_12370 [Rhizobium sp. SEMIA4064]
MRTILSIAALTVLFSAGVGFAQQAPNTATPTQPAQQPAQQPTQSETAPPANSPQPPTMGQRRPDDDAMRGDWHRGMMGHRPMMSKAARFRIESGDVKIDIKCAEDEPMKACADELNQILDRLEGRRSSSRDDDYQ